jgi:hypothetical protein
MKRRTTEEQQTNSAAGQNESILPTIQVAASMRMHGHLLYVRVVRFL